MVSEDLLLQEFDGVLGLAVLVLVCDLVGVCVLVLVCEGVLVLVTVGVCV